MTSKLPGDTLSNVGLAAGNLPSQELGLNQLSPRDGLNPCREMTNAFLDPNCDEFGERMKQHR